MARVARGLAVSRETEEAMTQVIAGVGSETAHTMVQRPRGSTGPVGPAYRPPYEPAAKKARYGTIGSSARQVVVASRRRTSRPTRRPFATTCLSFGTVI